MCAVADVAEYNGMRQEAGAPAVVVVVAVHSDDGVPNVLNSSRRYSLSLWYTYSLTLHRNRTADNSVSSWAGTRRRRRPRGPTHLNCAPAYRKSCTSFHISHDPPRTSQ